MAQHQEHGVNKVLAGPRLCRDSLGLEGAKRGTNHTAVKRGLSSPKKKSCGKGKALSGLEIMAAARSLSPEMSVLCCSVWRLTLPSPGRRLTGSWLPLGNFLINFEMPPPPPRHKMQP